MDKLDPVALGHEDVGDQHVGRQQQPVSLLVLERLPATLLLTGAAAGVAITTIT